MFKITLMFLLLTQVFGERFHCNHKNAINVFKRPTYDFSVRLLDRVAENTGYHFVFSPLSTWLQLVALAEGAKGQTENEIRKVTRHHRTLCFRRKYKEVINHMNEELDSMTKRTNVIILDKFLNVKKSYKHEIEKSNATKILSVNFKHPHEAAQKANEAIQKHMDGVMTEGLEANDFDLTDLVMTETAYFKSDWKTPFNPVYTSTESFYSEENIPIAKVRLMSQTGYFNLTELSNINARVIELPFNTNDRMSMLIFLPTKGSVKNLLHDMKDIRLMTIFHSFKAGGTKLVKVSIPRFNISTVVENIPELVYDMGIKRMFYPELADFRGISDYKVYISLMLQIANIEISEKGASADSVAEFLVSGKGNEEFRVDRPFTYLIVDRKTDIILFGGIYSDPSIE